MPVEGNQVIDAITYWDSGHIEVRLATVVSRDGIEIARMFHRHVVEPGSDVSREGPGVQAVAAALGAPELINAYRASPDKQPTA